MLMSRLAQDALTWLAVQNRAPMTIAQYDTVYRQFIAFLLSRGLTDDVRHLTDDQIRAWMLDLSQRGVHGNTIRTKLSALSTLARYAMTVRDSRGRPLLDHDPTRTFPWPTYTRPEKRFLYPQEAAAFVAVQRPPHEALVRDFLLETGLRANEVCTIDVKDFIQVGPEAYLVRARVKGRRGERVEVPLSPALGSRLKDALLNRGVPDGREPLFVNSRGQRWTRTALSELMARIGRQAGITRMRVSAHKLRHTANVVARIAGLDSVQRASLLNHRSLATLREYDHLIPGELLQARRRQAEALGRYLVGDVLSEHSASGGGGPSVSSENR